MKPRWKEVEKDNPWLETKYFDVDENEDLVKKYNIEHYPTFIFLDKDEKEIDRMTGEISKEKIINKINEHKGK
jgi:thioredoxin-related protein